jgi:hypothetical protein
MPVVQRRREGLDTSGGTDLADQCGDLLEPVAAASELVGQQGVAYVGRTVDPVARPRIATRSDQPGTFPFTQSGRAKAEPPRQGAHERVTALLRYGIEVAQRRFHGPERAAVVEQLGVTLVDEPERVLGHALVDRLHDRGGRSVTVSGHEREERP